MSLAWSAYRLMAPVVGAAAPAARLLAPAAERPFWDERLGRVAAAGTIDAWIHAASLGEALAVGPLVRELSRAAPAARFHLTATTAAGRARLATLGPPCSLAPLDSPQAVTRFMAALRPRRLFLIETELWPHWLLSARAAGVPVAIVSARLSARSVPRYLRLGRTFRGLVAGFGAVLCQGVADESRWRTLGATAARTAVVGNLKDDALPEPVADRAQARAGCGLDPQRPLLVLGSVRPGEVRVLARAWRALPSPLRADWQVVAVPRHPQVSAELRREAAREGQSLVVGGAPRDGVWRWDDRLGVLAGYYAAAEVAVVGGSFGPYGGHNPLEPAACGAAVIVGPHHAAQADAVVALRDGGGAHVLEASDDLTPVLATWLAADELRAKIGTAALAVVRQRRGAAARAVARLAAWDLWPVA